MNKQMLKLAGLGIGVIAMAALLSIPVAATAKDDDHGKHMAATSAPASAGRHGMCRMHAKKLGEALKAIDSATKAVEANDKKKALAELKTAKTLVSAAHKAMSQMGKGKFLNTSCPIMGGKLDPTKVTADLTKTFKGGKVGFCCASCLGAWDKLSDEDKEQKLRKSAAADGQGKAMDHGKATPPMPMKGHGNH